MNIMQGHVKKIIETYEFNDNPNLTEKDKKELELHLEIAVIEFMEQYEIIKEIESMGVSIEWKVKE